MATFTERIAKFIEQMSYEQLPEAALEACKRSILDCLGVALAGSEEHVGRIVSEYTKNSGKIEAGVIGGCFQTSIDQAAWIIAINKSNSYAEF